MKFRENIEKCVNNFINRLNIDKSMEIAFKKYYGMQNIDNCLKLLQYFDSYILSMPENRRNIISFVFGYIAYKKKNNINIKLGKNSLFMEYAKIIKIKNKKEYEKGNNKVNILLTKRKVSDIMKYLKSCILKDFANDFDYVSFICDLIYFERKSTVMKWGKDYYKEMNEIDKKEDANV